MPSVEGSYNAAWVYLNTPICSMHPHIGKTHRPRGRAGVQKQKSHPALLPLKLCVGGARASRFVGRLEQERNHTRRLNCITVEERNTLNTQSIWKTRIKEAFCSQHPGLFRCKYFSRILIIMLYEEKGILKPESCSIFVLQNINRLGWILWVGLRTVSSTSSWSRICYLLMQKYQRCCMMFKFSNDWARENLQKASSWLQNQE